MKVFRPTEVLFSPTTRCNLRCAHCDVERTGKTLSAGSAKRFLKGCRRLGVQRVGFTGGEPFLALDFLCDVSSEALRQGFLFDRIMTNGVWWSDTPAMAGSLMRLQGAGYDGSICVSVDAFHAQRIKKAAEFIKTAVSVWRRPDIVTVAYVGGRRDAQTAGKLDALDTALKGTGICIRKVKVPFSAAGRASASKKVWDGAWFKEDHCKGPGNAFFVLPGGDVKPCCGYATDRRELTVGNIRRDSAHDIMKNITRNRFVSSVFNNGLSAIRKRLEAGGWHFPGKTTDHCFFCEYLLKKVPRKVLAKALATILLFFFATTFPASAQEIKPAKDMRRIPAKVLRRIDIPTWYHEGMFYDGTSLWLANGEKGKIWVIDTSSGKVTSEIVPVADFAEALMRRPDGALFTTEWFTMKVYKVRLEGGHLMPESELSFYPAHPAGLASDGKRLFVVVWKRGLGTKFELVELDADMKIANRMIIKGIHEPDQLAWDGKDLWVSSWYSKRVYRIDTVAWEITGYFNSPVAKTTGIAWDGKYMWVTGTYGDLYQMEIGG